MENNNSQAGANRQTADQWSNDRLSALAPEHEWQPNLSRAFARLQQRRDAQHARGRRSAWTIAAIAATSLPLIAFPVTRTIAQRCVSECVKESSIVRDFFTGNAPGPAPPSTYLKPEDRAVAPDFTGKDASGRSVNLSEFRGKVVLLNFWATWCGPCKVEIPMLNGLQQKYRDRNFTVLGVSLEDDGWNAVKPYLLTTHVNYPVLVGSEDVATRYHGLDSIPMTFLIDQSGRIAAVHVGLCSRSEYEADLASLLK